MEFEITASVAAEAIAILENTEISLVAKVPLKILEMLQNKADQASKKVELDYTKSYSEQNISEEAKGIITLIYRQYWCTESEREELDKKLLENEEIKKRERYNPENIFKKVDEDYKYDTISKEYSEEKILTLTENLKWYQKIINKIKLFFNNNYPPV